MNHNKLDKAEVKLDLFSTIEPKSPQKLLLQEDDSDTNLASAGRIQDLKPRQYQLTSLDNSPKAKYD